LFCERLPPLFFLVIFPLPWYNGKGKRRDRMKRFACLLLTLGLLAGALAGCQQEETPSQSASTPAATAAPQETATPAPPPTAAPTAAPSKAPEATPAPAPEVGEELSMVEEEDGEFGLPGLTLGMSLEEVETAAALFPDAPQLEL